MLNELLIFITDERGYSYYVDAAGAVQLVAGQMPVYNSPKDWDNFEIKYGRSQTYFGLQRSMALPFKFVHDAAKIIRYIAINKGSEGKALLRLYLLNKAFGSGYRHELIYEADFDLSKTEIGITDTNAAILEAGFAKLFRANETQTFQIPVSLLNGAKRVFMHGLLFSVSGNYSFFNIETNYGQYVAPLVFISKEGPPIYTSLTSQALEPYLGSIADFYLNTKNSFFYTERALQITLQGKIRFKVKANPIGAGLRIHIRGNVRNELAEEILLYNSAVVGVLVPGQVVEINVNQVINLAAGERISIGAFHFTNAGNLDTFIIEWLDSDLKVSFTNKADSGYIPAYPAKRLFELICEKMFKKAVPVKSNLLTNNRELFFTSGDALRGFENAAIKISFADFFKAINLRYLAGFAFNDIEGSTLPEIELLTNFLQDDITHDLGTVQDCVLSFAEDRCFNKIKYGWPNEDYDEVNGRNEFNVTAEATTPLETTVRTYDITTPVRADMTGIELTRINLEGKSTTDSSSDNDTFALYTDGNEYEDAETFLLHYKLKRGPYDAINGLIDSATAFNVELSPKTCLLQHAPLLSSVLHYHGVDNIVWQVSDKNAALSYTIAGKTITENANENIGLLTGKRFIPWYFTVKALPVQGLYNIMKAKPYGKVQFTWKGRQWRGFVIETGTKPVKNDVQTWKLLASADNDLTGFI
ncbi:MAG: hypothetical protein SFU21_10870 [Flavihumibacter sp.]|nr:hypothetical protein [Flavihumibacter sp.]